ncbi:DUF2520 domain-containing protein [Thermotoga sp.]|uniref:Rossmann-like and DUF2520 domain-containing protein n=1 Tax=Thermotoga sp. TaxID=28240 RepID=UPI0025E34534|nr:DUF2520 domain-containing protein [Thermotoga sp.]MCD6551644.1 DUF2520 domain-containing protein [Thermotoga sp.]
MVLNFVGTGNLTRFFLECLKDRYELGYILSRNIERSINITEIYGGKPATLENHPLLCGVVFIIVPDRYIESVAKILKVKDGVLVHCSGFLASDVLRREKRASLHPNFSFSNLEKALKMKDQIVFGIEGDEEGIHVAVEIAKAISGKYIVIPPEKKKAYHLAAVVASNFPVALAYLSKRIYSSMGVEDPDHLISTLMQGVVESIGEMSVERALTGPVRRGDWEVVRVEREVFKKIFGSALIYDEIVEVLKEVTKGERAKDKEDER